jgi:curved DNA-binding protein CbpA
MTLDEAYLILGLDPGALRDDMLAAHRNLIKRLHPDQGGTCYLASQINEAKDVLMQHIKR